VCPARTPLSKNIIFYSSPEEALAAGFRPCKRCRPLDDPNAPGVLIDKLLALVEEEPSRKWSEEDLRDMGIEPATARRQFQRRFDMSFSQYARARFGASPNVFANASRNPLPESKPASSCASITLSPFRIVLKAWPSRRARAARAFVMDWIDTPLGPMLAVADEAHLHMLEFIERKKLQEHVERYRRQFNATMLPGETRALKLIRQELADYFAGRSLTFTSQIAGAGSDFQNEVWDELRRIPPGSTRSYQEIAQRIGRPTAMRAVANANRLNRCAIILPCHRVIGADGTLTGYAGGLWRKQWLLDHERRHAGDWDRAGA
jgi:AraC family transcriptional regulator of adaptative response/methylated-DNA-[protein]-cysteine methyltransferase